MESTDLPNENQYYHAVAVGKIRKLEIIMKKRAESKVMKMIKSTANNNKVSVLRNRKKNIVLIE